MKKQSALENKGKFYKTADVLIKTFTFVFFAEFIWLFISLCFFNNSTNNYNTITQLICAFAMMMFLMGGYLLIQNIATKKIKFRKIIDEKFTLIFTVTMAVIFSVQVFYTYQFFAPPGWDCGNIITASQLPNMNEDPYYSFYYSQYPNNLTLLLFFRIIHKIFLIFGITNISFVLVILNIIAVDCAIIFTVFIAKKIFSKKVAYIAWAFSILILGFSPWLIIPYSDTLSMPFIVGAIYFYFCIFSSKVIWKKVAFSALMGITVSIGFCIKPTVIIILIAAAIAHILFTKIKKETLIHSVSILMVIVLSFSISSILLKAVTSNQKSIKIIENVTTPMTHFFMMGMKKIPAGDKFLYGTYNLDDYKITFEVSDEVTYKIHRNTEEMKEINIKEIKKRFNDFGVKGYIEFLSDKCRWITSEGIFFWGGEGSFVDWSKMHSKTLCNLFCPVGSNYNLYLYFSQAMWIITMLCIVLPLIFKKVKSRNRLLFMLRLSIFGSILFLLLFEGRSRYLINSLPLFILLAAYGFNSIFDHDKIKFT